MAASFNPRRMSFWNDYHPELVQVKFYTEKEVVSGAEASFTMGTLFQIVFIAILTIF